MKLTTKIIFGIILSVFAISLLFIIGFAFTDRKHYQRVYNTAIQIPQDNMTKIELEPYRIIVLDMERTDTTNEYSYGFSSENCGLFLNRATTNKENKLFIPETLHDFISTKIKNDTLTIGIKVDDLRKKHQKENAGNHTFFEGANLNLYTSNANVINKISAMRTSIQSIETDSIKVTAWGEIQIDSCKATIINPDLKESYRMLTIKNSYAKTINLDLDRIENYNIEHCVIEEENLTGSKEHSIVQHRNESGKINWLPKNKEAELNIKIQGDTTQIIFQ